MLAGQAADGLSALIGTERVQKGDSSTREGCVGREWSVCWGEWPRKVGESGNELSVEVRKSAEPLR